MTCRAAWFALVLGACGDNHSVPVDAPVRRPDAPGQMIDAPMADAPPLVRVYGNISPNVVLTGSAETIEGPARTAMLDGNGDFYFDVPDGSRLIMRVPASVDGHLPMIRGVIAHDHLRPRVNYLLGPDELSGTAAALGVTFDPSTAILEVDFRNAEIGGYGVTLTGASGVITPSFGVVLDGSDAPQLGQLTVVGGNGSTLLLAGLPPGNVSFTPIVPSGATLPCQPRDADPLPLVAGAVTWFDYECGTGQD